ncbi:MAG: preprotein translocase subunit SecY [Firmicutes bacterium ADurb.Bin300]|nr:MAG: preprotein translocase subunit SecY [Firmicutes bacterium ADurb.Bin300]
MLKTLVNAWKIPDLRTKLIYTAFVILVFRIGANIPVPFLNITEGILNNAQGTTFLSYLSMMTGDAFNYGTIFAMSVTPYINSSIIMQLLTVAIPYLERLQKEGEEGRKKIASITRYVTVVLGFMQSTAYYMYLRSQNYLMTDASGAAFTGFWAVFQAAIVILCLTAGTALVMWLGEQVNEKGIGNGISIILFAGIISRIPTEAARLFSMNPSINSYFFRGGPKGVYYYLAPLVVIIYILMLGYIVWMDNAEHRIPVQYAKRVVGRKMYGGQNTHIPIKVMPVIFASSILSIPPTIEMFVQNKIKEDGFWDKFFGIFRADNWKYAVIYFLMIIFFAYFYAAIQYNPVEMANNIRKNGGAILGIRPGKPTSDYIGGIIGKIIIIGALLLSVVALFPIIFSIITEAALGEGNGMNITLGGTSIIIMVGVALETVKQLESQMMMRHYKGFLD